MATCNYSAYVGASCGSSTVNATVLQCVPLENCQKDVRVHLRALEVRDAVLHVVLVVYCIKLPVAS